MNQTIGQAIEQIRTQHGLRMTDLAKVLNISPGLLGKIIRGEREFSFLMALRLFEKFNLSVEVFVSMLSERELNRTDLSSIRYFEKLELSRAAAIKTKVIEAQDLENMPGKELAALVLSHIQDNKDIKQLEELLKGIK